MEIRLDGRAALVTGGSKGLGLAMASRFAAAGADVAILARGADALEAARAGIAQAAPARQVVAIACDVSDASALAAAYARAEAALGKVDILVNNAGTSRAGPFDAASDADWQADFELKLFSAIRLARLALPGMRQRRWGRILNVLNTAAKAPPARSAPTSVTRAAGLALTKVLANEGAAHGVLVNALLVGLFDTDQHRARALAAGEPPEQHLAGLARRVPLGRVGDADEFARLACFLSSDAGSYVTGAAINVDGGMSPVP